MRLGNTQKLGIALGFHYICPVSCRGYIPYPSRENGTSFVKMNIPAASGGELNPKRLNY